MENLYPQINFRLHTFDLIEFNSRLLPDENRQNVLDQLEQQIVWLPFVSYGLKHGDQFTLYGSEALKLLQDSDQVLTNGAKLEILYFGPVLVPTPTPTASPSATPAPTPTATPTPTTSPSPTATPSPT